MPDLPLYFSDLRYTIEYTLKYWLFGPKVYRYNIWRTAKTGRLVGGNPCELYETGEWGKRDDVIIALYDRIKELQP